MATDSAELGRPAEWGGVDKLTMRPVEQRQARD